MSRKTRNWHGNRCRIVLRVRIFVGSRDRRPPSQVRHAAYHGRGPWCSGTWWLVPPPPQVGDGAGRREPTMLNGGGDTSITISGTRLSDLNSIAGRQNARRAPPALRRDPRKLRGIGAGASASSIPVQTSSSRLSSAAATFALCSSAKRWQLPWEIHVPRAGRRRPLPGRRCQRCRRI
jgi:hypothetical protein